MLRIDDAGVRGWLHERAGETALVLAHGAGADCDAPLLRHLAGALPCTVLRIDLPFRMARASGPPRAGDAERDREGLAAAVDWLRARTAGRVFLGGHSYGGRQASLSAAESPRLAAGLVLLSYPLHPPRGGEWRTAHFPAVRTPALFVHGTRDPFGSEAELRQACALIPAPVTLEFLDRTGHDLSPRAALVEEAVSGWITSRATARDSA